METRTEFIVERLTGLARIRVENPLCISAFMGQASRDVFVTFDASDLPVLYDALRKLRDEDHELALAENAGRLALEKAVA